MAERMIKRRASRLVRSPSTESSENTIDTHNMGKSIKKKTKKPKERWLLTRKTWRYMTDAGRKLIPDGAQNKPEDLPKIEAYFQEVCKKEPKFLLWRKNSYPGALNIGRKRRDRFKGGSCRKASSAGEFDIKPERPKDLAIHAISGGRFDLHKMKHDFLNKPHSPTNQRSFPKSRETPSPTVENREEHSNDAIEERKQLANMLEQYLSNTTSSSPRTDFNYQELIDKLQKHLVLERNTLLPSPSSIPSTSSYSERVHFEGDHVQKNLSETLSRYFSQLPNRDKVISDMLTNRKALEKLYFELRKTKGFRSRSNDRYSGQNQPWSPSLLKNYSKADNNSGVPAQPSLPPPVIEIQTPAVEITYRNHGIQTVAIPETELLKIEEEYKKMIAERDDDCGDGVKSSYRRRSSVDNDDVSQSVSDTIKRYLRMARKKSVDSDKADRFKRVNYDRNLRNIKAKGEITKPGDDDGLSKGCQTNENWIVIYRDLKFDEYPVSEAESRLSSARSSIDIGIVEEKASPTSSGQKSSHSFLSNLLHGKHGHDKSASAASATGNMQKSKSSSNVHHAKSKLTKKSLFKSRSKSQTRPSITTSNWTPQGSCVWNSIAGKQVLLGDTSLLQLTQTERKLLQKVALAKLQALNLGVSITLPTDSVAPVASKPKRKTYLLKRKALTTGIFDTNRKDVEKEKDVSTSGGLVFGIPLPQCIENDRLSRIASGASSLRSRDDLPTFDEPSMERHGSRASFSSLVDTDRTEEKGSCDNLLSRDRIVGSVPGLLNTISCNSTIDILAASNEDEPAVPNILNACIRHLELYGLHTLGLFRVSTSKKRIRQLREDFDCGKEIVLESDQCPHDVATLIKEYLRELPDPLLCRDLYHAFVHTQKIRNRRLQLEALQYLVQLLPPANRDTLYTLLKFLANVAKHSNDSKNALGQDVLGNKMDANNLATVFAPNILHCIKPGSKDNSGDRPEDRTDVINVVRTLIEHNKDLFEISSELLDEVYVHMMDSHPEILDNLLSKKEDGIAAEESLDDLDSESLSAPWSPEQNSHLDYAGHRTFHGIDDHDMNNEHRKMYSREEFLHETAATGGPDIAMKIRYKDRYREKSKKKRDESNIRRKKEEDMGIAMKTRSSSIESNSYHETGQMTDRRKSSPYLLDSSGVITASLTIPVQTGNQALPLNVEDGIPYIEDGSYIYNSDGRQQMTTDVTKSPTAPQRRRQRSISGSDSSAASNIHPVTGSISIGQQGYDSAMGSSATFSTPPHNTTPSSVSSSIADPGVLSSPPSWASTPPTSPDSQCTSVNYIPDDISSRIVRTIPVQKPSNVIIKDSPILQKITFTSTSELQQLQKPKQIEVKSQRKENIQKSPSSPAFVMEKQAQERDYSKFSTSITSIGNAVLRSRTADFERISKTDGKPATTTVTQKTVTSEKKKYTKRRYTDSRHQTRHIPDSETLEAASNSSTSTTKTDKNTNQSGPVYKRREIISSVPSR